jgi:response regulator RpfG family c-di-GMP phosphodiesterase
MQRRGESLRKARTATTVLQMFAIVFLFGLIWLFAHVAQRYSAYQENIREDALWHVSQIDRAARRLHEAITVAAITGNVADDQVEEIAASFDILYSQTDVIENSTFGKNFVAGEVADEIGVVRKWVDTNVPVFDRIEAGEKPGIPELQRMKLEVNGLFGSTTRLLALSIAKAQDSRAEARMTIFDAQIKSVTLTALLFITVTVLIVLLRRQLKTMGLAASEMEAVSGELREANRKLSDKAAWLRSEVDKALAELKERDKEIVDRLSLAASYKDAELGSHTKRVGAYSEAIARHMNLDDDFCSDLRLASPMHDIGKVAIPESVLLKAGPLTCEEFADMKRHTVIGCEILSESKSPLLQLAAEIAESHHEYWDGSGYPKGASGSTIPLAARIVAVADTFDALTTIRPYKNAWTVEEAVAYIIGRSGDQFDPECIEGFRKAREEILAIMGEEVATTH